MWYEFTEINVNLGAAIKDRCLRFAVDNSINTSLLRMGRISGGIISIYGIRLDIWSNFTLAPLKVVANSIEETFFAHILLMNVVILTIFRLSLIYLIINLPVEFLQDIAMG